MQILYDPSRISYKQLLTTFFRLHDPTARSTRQYMSLVLFETKEEEAEAKEIVQHLSPSFRRPISTEIAPLRDFFQAENYHQKYLLRQTPKLFHTLGLDGDPLIDSPLAAKLNAVCGGYLSADQMQRSEEIPDRLAEVVKSVRPAMAACGL